MDCWSAPRRLGWALNTVKRYARAERVEDLLRPPRYGACLLDAHRDLIGSPVELDRLLLEADAEQLRVTVEGKASRGRLRLFGRRRAGRRA